MNKKNVSKIIASSMIVANIPTSLAVELIDEKISDINNIENLYNDIEDNLVNEDQFNHNQQNETNNITKENLSNDVNTEKSTSDSNDINIEESIPDSNDINTEESTSDIDNKLDEIESKYSGGYGTENSPYLIGSVEDLIQLSIDINLNKEPVPTSGDSESVDMLYYKLINDIDFNDYQDAKISSSFNSIGTVDNPFVGVFDGDGYTIKNLNKTYVPSRPSKQGVRVSYYGLFGAIRNSNIKNLNLDSFNIKGDGYVGALSSIAIGDNTIDNVNVYNLELSGSNIVGSIIGLSINDNFKEDSLVNDFKNKIVIKDSNTLNISNSNVDGNLYCSGDIIGGFIGASHTDINIDNSISKINIDVNESNYVGGFVGGCINVNIDESEFDGKISNAGQYVGGFVGYADESEILNSTSAGLIESNSISGGFIGKTYKLKVNNLMANNTLESQEGLTGGIVGMLSYRNTLGNEPSKKSLDNFIINTNINSSLVSQLGTGGFIGISTESINIKNSNFKGDIISEGIAGGFIGVGITNFPPILGQSSQLVKELFDEENINVTGLINNDAIINISSSNFQGNIYSSEYAGGFIGGSNFDKLIINNCNTTGNIYSDSNAGGFIGYASCIDIIDSENKINISSIKSTPDYENIKSSKSGKSRVHTSDIGVVKSNIGGLVGRGDFINIKGTKSNSVILSSSHSVGGLVGECNGSLNIQKSEVEGKIKTSSSDVGGLVGCFYFNKDKDTFNDISASQNSLIYVKDCINNLDIQGYECIGGFVGNAILYQEEEASLSDDLITTESFNSVKIIDSQVKGNITGEESIGGLIGYIDNRVDIVNTNVEANVIGIGDYVSGMVASSEGEVNISDSSFKGGIDGKDCVGSFIGKGYFVNILNSSAKSNIYSNGNFVGGLVALSYDIMIENSQFNGKIHAQDYTGGLIGIGGNISTNNITVEGNINGKENVGGLIGISIVEDDSSYIKSSYVKANINGAKNIGGIVGYVFNKVDGPQLKNIKNEKLNAIIANTKSQRFNDDEYFNIYKSSYEGNLKGIGYVGGLIGYSTLSNLSMINVYSSGNLDASLNIGRFIGCLDSYNPPKISIKNGYSATKLISDKLNTNFNFIGSNFEDNSPRETNYYVTIENLYYDKDLNDKKFNPIEEEIFNDSDKEKHFIVGLSTKNMQNNRPLQFMKLDYENIWFTNKDYYPTFIQKDAVEDNVLPVLSVEIEKDSKLDVIKLILREDDYITNEKVEVIEHNVDVSTPGVYFIKYKIIDDDGYELEREMKVTVINKDDNNSTEENKPESGDNNNNNNNSNNNNGNNNNNNNNNNNSNNDNSNNDNNNNNSNNTTNTNNNNNTNNTTTKPSTGDNSLTFMIATIVSSLGLTLLNKNKDKNKK